MEFNGSGGKRGMSNLGACRACDSLDTTRPWASVLSRRSILAVFARSTWRACLSPRPCRSARSRPTVLAIDAVLAGRTTEGEDKGKRNVSTRGWGYEEIFLQLMRGLKIVAML